MAKKYYWLKLQKDFFKRHDIRIIESMDNGEIYILFYMKLLVESIDHEGQLRFSEMIPYDDKMLATITNTNVDIVRSAIKIFTELGLMETLTDKTIYMNEISKMIGAETEWAKKKRLYREEQNLLTQENNGFTHGKEVNNENSEDIVRGVSDESPNCPATLSDKSKRLEKEIELDIDYKEKNTKKEIRHKYGEYKNVLLSEKDFNELVELWGMEELLKSIENLSSSIQSKGYKYKDFKATLKNWKKNESKFNSFKPAEKVDKFQGEANFEL